MDIKISNESIEKSINSVVDEAIGKAMEGYEIQEAISEAIAKQVSKGLVSDAIDKAIKAIDINDVTNSIALNLQRNVIKGVNYIIKESFIDTIMNLKKINSYDSKYELERQKVTRQVFK